LKYKLWVLNGVLVAVIAYGGVALHQQWKTSRAREASVLSANVKASAAPPFSPAPAPPPVTASDYAQIAMRTLFDPSRNPNVVVEVPPPPPPPVMPPLPVCYGVMNLGDGAGAAAILAENDKSAHQFLHPGATIGQFKLVDVNTDEIVLEWNGKEVRKRLTDLVAAPAEQPQAQAAAAAPEVDRTPAAAPPPAKVGPGEDTGRGFKTCSINDGLADGAEKDGYRKKVTQTPFGPMCAWYPVQ